MSKEFFDVVRSEFGPLRTTQVMGLQTLLDATAKLPIAHRAYILGTAWHETGPESSALHMTPRREIWGPTKAQLGYEGRKDLGNTKPGDGRLFAGRGYVQITGRANYAKASKLVGRDLVANPDLALDPQIAAAIIVDGMAKGWFTGKKMGDYVSYKDMRRVVNGTDRAELIATYAASFEKALKAIPDTATAPIPPPPDIEPPPIEVPDTAAGKSIAGWLIAAIGAAFAFAGYFLSKG